MTPSLRLVSFAFVLSCTGHGGIPVHDDTTWTGWQRYRFGNGATVDDLNCDVYWTVQGVSTNASCMDCAFAFDLSLTIDEDQSFNDGTCLDMTDMDLTYGYVDDWNGQGPMLGTVRTGEFYPAAAATWDEDAGTIVYVQGNLGYDAGAYYYVDYFEGYGLITIPNADDTAADDTAADAR